MRARLLTYRLFFVLTLLPVSCSKDLEQQSDCDTDEPILFSTEFANATTRSTTLDNIWTSNQDVISVSDGTNVYNYKPASTSVSSESQVNLITTGQGAFYWTTDKRNRTFTAWYPNTNQNAQSNTVTVSADQSSISDTEYYNQDRLYAPAVTIAYKQTASLRFYHQLSRVIIIMNTLLTRDDENDNKTENVCKVQFGNNNICISREVQQFGETGSGASAPLTSWQNISSASSSIQMRKMESDEANDIYIFECILPPQEGGDTDTPLLTIETNKNKYIYKASYNLKAGYQHTYNISLSKIGIIAITLASVSDWGLSGSFTGVADIPDASY